VTKDEPEGEHAELGKSPWEREQSYRIHSMRMGRPDLPGVEAEIEALLRLIGTLPKRVPWWPGQGNVFEIAYEVRALLEPRIITVTLGNGDAYADWYLSGPGDAAGRCAVLCLPHPTEDNWSKVDDRTLLFDGEAKRTRLARSVKRSAQDAVKELNRHWIHSPELTGQG
jgi:hypothetical protein